MAYVDQYTVANDGEFCRRVKMAIIDAAKDVYSEDPGTAGHERRSALAGDILRSSDNWVSPFAYAVAEAGETNGTSDATLKTAVSSVWNALAGA